MSTKKRTSLSIVLVVALFVGIPNTVVVAKHRDFDIDGYSIEKGRITAWNVEAHDVTSTAATIVWKTSQAVPTWLRYGETVRFGGEYKDEIPKTDHRVTLESLKPGTLYLYTVFIQEGSDVARYHYGMESQMVNYTSSPSFTTLTLKQEAEKLNTQIQSGTERTITFRFYGSKIEIGMPYLTLYQDTEHYDFSIPRITSMNVQGNSSQATLSWTTEHAMSEVFIEYGPDQSYGFWKHVSCTEDKQCTSHSAVLDGLSPGEMVHVRMKMRSHYSKEKTATGYSHVQIEHFSFVAPRFAQVVSIAHSSSDYTAPALTSIGVKKIAGENRRVSFIGLESSLRPYYDIARRVELTITTDEPAQVSIELLSVEPDSSFVGSNGTVVKEEILSSAAFNTTTILAFEPALDVKRDYMYSISAKDAAGNQHSTRFFRINARGSTHQDNGGTLTAPRIAESITAPPQTTSLPIASSPIRHSTPLFSPSQQPTLFVTSSQSTMPSPLAKKLAGRILLQVQRSGEAWYVHPKTFRLHYLGRPSDALRVMREQGIGIMNADLERIARAGESRAGDTVFAKKHAGKIFLQIQGSGEAWYVHPLDLKRYFLGRPSDALAVMRTLGLGISNSDIEKISTP